MPIPGPTPYQYKIDDDPVTLAQQNGITPGQLLQANPGGYPFATGQTINIPFQYGTPTPAGSMADAVNANFNQRGRGFSAPPAVGQYTGGIISTANLNNSTFRGRGVRSFYDPAGNSPDMGGDSWWRPQVPAGTTTTPAGPTGDPNNGYGGFVNTGGADNTDFANTAAAQYNAAHNIPFLQQSRWDPRRRRYISVGQWLRQNRRGGRGRGGGGGARRSAQQKQQEFTLTNSFIDFNAAAG